MSKFTKEYFDDLYEMGLSAELTERIDAGGVVDNMYGLNDSLWSIRTYPPTERDDLMYFIIYKDATFGIAPEFSAPVCARISLTVPEYIRCSDCNKEEWILNPEEKEFLCNFLKKNNNYNWDMVLRMFSGTLLDWDGKKIDISNLPMPDYSKLP